jgi:hypothetical protein
MGLLAGSWIRGREDGMSRVRLWDTILGFLVGDGARLPEPSDVIPERTLALAEEIGYDRPVLYVGRRRIVRSSDNESEKP